jgi:glutamyl-tRNA reductase
MSLVVVGLSHHTSPIELRERLHFSAAEIPQALMTLRRRIVDAGAVILSTCNRVEIYAHHPDATEELYRELRRFLSVAKGVDESDFDAHLYQRSDSAVAGHLFRVASSLDSLVVGEDQILGQVKDAYLLAQAEQSTDKVISVLFQKAFSVAGEIRTKSRIGEGKVSIGSVAVDLAVSIFTDLAGKTVMIIGSGEMGELTLKSLIGRGVARVLLVNRSVEKAQELSAKYQGEPMPMDLLNDLLHLADIVVVSTSSPEYVLKREHFVQALRQRSRAPMCVVDISVPRNVAPDVNTLDNVYLYDVDALQETANQNMAARQNEIEQCMLTVEARAGQFWQWMQGLLAEPTIVSMSRELNAIRERELTKTLRSLPDLTDTQRAEIEYLSKRIVNNILQRPMTQLKQEVVQQDAHNVLHLVKRLFGLEN